ncbi:unnamed protein product [Adineta steineri]|uniref:Glutathione peroxidase n=1 Tax=Adineta steineri TaxID=433720 RepID=A0A813ML14_9BILA|nr:unnamed protein product [Adineta steineri]CAF1385493.1 unnamed protein product [Adineta steineri]CAF1547830.1 unnamed protein product [Adineta steineri]CAF1609028.1 unnamed protein product [Adineta steineri]
MSILPITTVKGKDSSEDNERKKSLQQQRDFIIDLLKHYSIVALDMKYCKEYILIHVSYKEFSKTNQFTILGIPCNQFGYQEPAETKTELLNGLKYVRPGNNFLPNFPLFWIVDVNGKNQHPLYEYLKACVPSTKKYFEDHTMIFYEPHHSDDIRWNFEKFLIDSNGHPIMRFDSDAEPLFIRQFIEKLLQFKKYI